MARLIFIQNDVSKIRFASKILLILQQRIGLDGEICLMAEYGSLLEIDEKSYHIFLNVLLIVGGGFCEKIIT